MITARLTLQYLARSAAVGAVWYLIYRKVESAVLFGAVFFGVTLAFELLRRRYSGK